ncbi:MAG: hypothetical protein JXQ96_22855 [Cyclobacteriaceae bacterium]
MIFFQEKIQHNNLLTLTDGKSIDIDECGALPNPAIFDTQNKWSWFTVWSGYLWQHNTPEKVNAIYNHSKVKSETP